MSFLKKIFRKMKKKPEPDREKGIGTRGAEPEPDREKGIGTRGEEPPEE